MRDAMKSTMGLFLWGVGELCGDFVLKSNDRAYSAFPLIAFQGTSFPDAEAEIKHLFAC